MALFAAIGLLNAYTPLSFDDWWYEYVWGTNDRIQSLTDIFHSQITHYQTQNGRFTVHSILQFFVGLTPKWAFSICNTLAFICFCVLVSKVANTRGQCGLLVGMSLTALFIVLFYPAFSDCFLWLSGSCNYLWAATLFLLFQYIFLHSLSHRLLFPAFVLGVVCGWTHEAIILPALAGHFATILFRKVHLSSTQIALLAGLFMGGLLLIVSPGSINRLHNVAPQSPSLVAQIRSGLGIFTELRLFWLLIITLAYCRLRRLLSFKHLIKCHMFDLVCIISAFLLVFVSGSRYPRAYFGIELFSLLLLVRMIPTVFSLTPSKVACACCLSFVAMCCTFSDAQTAFTNAIATENAARITTDGIVGFNEPLCPAWSRRFIKLNHVSQYDEFYDGFMADAESNRYWQRRFNKDTMLLLPQQFVLIAKERPEQFADFNDMDGTLPFYARLVPAGAQFAQATFHLGKAVDIPFYFRPFASRMARFTANDVATDKVSKIRIGGQHFAIVKKNENIAFRVKTITLH